MPPPKSDKIQFEIFILFIILDKFYDLIYIHRLDFVCALIADFPVFVDNRHRISDIGGAALEIEFFVYLGRARVIAGRNIPGLFVVGDPNLYSENCTAPQKLDTFGVFFMKYNYEIRLKAVKLVLEGGLSVREAGCHLGCGRSQVHLWVTLFERHGLTGLKLRHGSYSAEFKLSVLKHMHQNHLSLLETAVHFGIPGPFVIRQWERLYQNQGAEGLRRKPQRRRPAMSKSKTKKVKLKTTPHEELLKELEYLRAENAYLKKLQALVEERIVRESGKEPKPSKD
jgi:ISPsy8, transposase orfA